jgi:hypothetical protein
MLHIFQKIGTLIVILTFVGGCKSLKCDPKQPKIQAVHITEPVKIDGKLTEPAWKRANVYKLELAEKAYYNQPMVTQKIIGNQLREDGEYRLLWDENNFYIGISFSDSDIYAYGQKDEMHHYSLGDVAEIFLKPEDDTYYWEFYVTPKGRKTTFFIPGRGCLMIPVLNISPINIKVASRIKGSLNNWLDRDKAWTAEVAIPITELEKYGTKFGPNCKWKIFLARYNYSRYLPVRELSSVPKQEGVPNCHTLEDYGKLEFVK